MIQALPLLALAFLQVTPTASLHVPVISCLPEADATIVSQSTFQVPDIANSHSGDDLTANLTLTYFTCPGLGNESARSVSERTPPIATGQDQMPIFVGGIMEGSVASPSAYTWNCDQAPVPIPTLADCNNIDTDVVDSLIRPMNIIVPASSGLIVSLSNNTCAFVFLNTDLADVYTMELEDISDMNFLIMEGCGPTIQFEDGFVGSVISARSPEEPNNLNWEVHIVASNFLDDQSSSSESNVDVVEF